MRTGVHGEGAGLSTYIDEDCAGVDRAVGAGIGGDECTGMDKGVGVEEGGLEERLEGKQDSLVFESTCYFCRGLEVEPQYPHELPVTQMLSLGTKHARGIQTYMQACTQTHTGKKIIKLAKQIVIE